jgi:uncharacterized membrane protein YeaQ/YmgE (transglycosylase-associated protein family)
VNFLLWIILGGLAGWIAEKVMKFDTGLLANIGLGIAGSVVGNMLLGGMMGGGLLPQLLIAVIGACALVFVYRLIKGRSAA